MICLVLMRLALAIALKCVGIYVSNPDKVVKICIVYQARLSVILTN